MQARRQKGKKKRDEESQRRRKAAGERFIREDGISRRGRWRAKEEMERGDRAEVDLGREGGEEMEKAHPLSADCCSVVDRSHHQINKVCTRPPHPHPTPPCCLFHYLLTLTPFFCLVPYSPSHPPFYLRHHQHRNANCCDLNAASVRRMRVGVMVSQLWAQGGLYRLWFYMVSIRARPIYWLADKISRCEPVTDILVSRFMFADMRRYEDFYFTD